MRATIIILGIMLCLLISLLATRLLAQDGIHRITIPENTKLTGELDQAKVSAKVGTSRRVESLRFLVEKQGNLRTAKTELEFGAPFYVELVFTGAQDPEKLDVSVTLGDGRALSVQVLQQSNERKRYLSKALTLERLEDQP